MISAQPDTLKNLWQIEVPSFHEQIRLNTDIAIAFPLTVDSNQQAVNLGQQCCMKAASAVPLCMNPSNLNVISTLELLQTYANDNQAFLDAFALSYSNMVSVGYSIYPHRSGKLGILKNFDCDKCNRLFWNCGGDTCYLSNY